MKLNCQAPEINAKFNLTMTEVDKKAYNQTTVRIELEGVEAVVVFPSSAMINKEFVVRDAEGKRVGQDAAYAHAVNIARNYIMSLL